MARSSKPKDPDFVDALADAVAALAIAFASLPQQQQRAIVRLVVVGAVNDLSAQFRRATEATGGERRPS